MNKCSLKHERNITSRGRQKPWYTQLLWYLMPRYDILIWNLNINVSRYFAIFMLRWNSWPGTCTPNKINQCEEDFRLYLASGRDGLKVSPWTLQSWEAPAAGRSPTCWNWFQSGRSWGWRQQTWSRRAAEREREKVSHSGSGSPGSPWARRTEC